MTKLKSVVLKTKKGICGDTNIKIRLTHDGMSREIATPFYINPKYMGKDGQVKQTNPDHTNLNKALMELLIDYNRILTGIGSEIVLMDINTLISKLHRKESTSASFILYTNERIRTLQEEERFSYAESYQSGIKWVLSFTNKTDILFKEINLDFLERFQRYLAKEGKRINTIRIYLNNIKAVFNHAIDNNVIRQELYPFRKFKVRKEKPEHRALTITEMRKLSFMPYTKAQKKAIDIFFLSFYLIGMNMKDLLYLTHKNIVGDRIVYKRAKTDRRVEERLSVKLTQQVKELFDLYKGQKYLIDCLDKDDSYVHFKTVVHNINNRLKFAGNSHGIPKLTTYYARHSWGTIASYLGISEDTISHAFGHIQNEITSGYIKYDLSFLDNANQSVIKAVHETESWLSL